MADEFPKMKHEVFLPVQVIAHEYAHSIQGQTGIIISNSAWRQYFRDNDDEYAARAINRQLEVQADCWAGQFVRAVDGSIGLGPEGMFMLFDLMIELGDDTLTGDPTFVGTHGQGASRQAWFIIGLEHAPISACNSFAPDVPEDSYR